MSNHNDPDLMSNDLLRDLFPPNQDYKVKLLTLSGMGGPFRPPLSENRDFSRTEPLLDLRPVCKLRFVRCGPGGKKQRALSFSVEAWRLDEVRGHLFPNSEIEIFIDFCRFLTKDLYQVLLGVYLCHR